MTTRDEDLLKDQVMHIVETLNNGFEGYGEENEDGDIQSAYDYLQDVLDIHWVLNNDRTYRGARLLVCFGGPNVWIDTNTGYVEGYWWGDACRIRYNSDSEFARELDAALEELFGC